LLEDDLITFCRINPDDMPWDKLSEFSAANIFQTWPWINFLADFLGAEPVVAIVQSDGQAQGYFMGLITKKLGLKILGSPFRGWNTYFMGFNLMPGVSYHAVLEAFPKFAFNELKCHFLMIVDTSLKEDELNGLTYHIRRISNFVLDLTISEPELFESMQNRYARRSIRRAGKKGVVIEEATDPGFADEYYAQYKEVNTRKSLTPYYGLNFIRQMIDHLLPTGNLLLLRARNHAGFCIATHITLVYNKVAVAWGAASFQQYFNLNPNELIYWDAMKRAKAMGAEVMQLGDGVREFKEKLGAYETQAFRLMKARNPGLYIPIFVAFSIYERVRRWRRKGWG
jgi:hypothetical protein